MKRENPRSDFVTRVRYPKSELLRFVVTPAGLLVDKEGVALGRGFYMKRDLATLQLALKKRAFERILHRSLTHEELASIKEAL